MRKQRAFLRRTWTVLSVLLFMGLIFGNIPAAEAAIGPDTAAPVAETESTFTDYLVRIGLNYGSSALSKITVSSDTGGNFGIVKDGSYTAAVSFTELEIFSAKPDSGYHLQLTSGMDDFSSAQTALTEIRQLLADTYDTTPFYLYNGSQWFIGVSFYQQYPGPGVLDVNELEKWTPIATALEGSPYSISVHTAGANSIKTYINNSPVMVLSTGSTSAKVRVCSATRESASLPPLLRLDKARYRGCFDLSRVNGSNLVVVNELEVEPYLYSVVPAEMVAGTASSYTQRKEGLKAQAVLARTAAYTEILNNRQTSYGFHLYRDTNSQMYGGYTKADGTAGEYENSTKAVNETTGTVVTYNDKVVSSLFYSANNGGYIETPDNVWSGSSSPYYVSKPDPWNPASTKATAFTGLSLSNTLVSYFKSNRGLDIGAVRYINITSRSQSGRVTELLVEGVKNDAVLTKQAARTALGQRSQLFEFAVDCVVSIQEQADGSNRTLSDRARAYLEGNTFSTAFLPDSYAVRTGDGYLYERIRVYATSVNQSLTVTAQGYGHGCGMSQDGAAEMSKAGKTYKQIIEFYLPGVILKTIPNQ